MLLEVKNGSFSYGEHEVLKDISFQVENNDVFAILGRNGAGKTTLLKCIMNLLPWKSGAALLNGENMSTISRKQLWQSIAYVPQAKRGSDYMVRDMVVLGRSSHIGVFEKPGREDYEIADEVLERLYMSNLANKSCLCLSGGELQLVLIARALAAKPKLLVMDEPESNLDYHNQLHVLDLISEISKETACIINTHYPEHALRYASKALILLRDGTSLSGAASEVITEGNLHKAFGIDVYIGEKLLGGEAYKYILPLHRHEEA